MTSTLNPLVLLGLGMLLSSPVAILAQSSGPLPGPRSNPSSTLPRPPQGQQTAEKQGDSGTLPRGQKLVLKDGNFQLVRSYQRDGERVRYYSLERAAWEEIPASMVDWDATAKAGKERQAAEAALLKKVHTLEQAQKIETALDIDASLQVGPKTFLPPGEGMFLIEGPNVTPLTQASSQVKADKKRTLEQIISPVPIVPSKRNIEIPGSKAQIRVVPSKTERIEFYLREAPPDPDRASPILKSSRPGESGPELVLLRATVKGNSRRLQSISSILGHETSTQEHSVAMQRWEVAPFVYRFTLAESLTPGEYALAEILPDGMNVYVWDFGVDDVKLTH
ncbi:MAG: hypothetical protein NVS9B4_21080 [Candidatus Acidiferrum sp.]